MLTNYALKNIKVATPYGIINLDAEGKSDELSQEHQKELASKVTTYSYEAPKVDKPKEDKPKEEKPKVEKPKVEKPAKEETKEATKPKKATPKKTTDKK